MLRQMFIDIKYYNSIMEHLVNSRYRFYYITLKWGWNVTDA